MASSYDGANYRARLYSSNNKNICLEVINQYSNVTNNCVAWDINGFSQNINGTKDILSFAYGSDYRYIDIFGTSDKCFGFSGNDEIEGAGAKICYSISNGGIFTSMTNETTTYNTGRLFSSGIAGLNVYVKNFTSICIKSTYDAVESCVTLSN